MWFSPGMFLAGVYIYVIWLIYGDVSMWWVWLTGLLGAMIIDACLGIERRKVQRSRSRTVYARRDEPDDPKGTD